MLTSSIINSLLTEICESTSTVITDCFKDYTIFDEETGDFNVGWSQNTSLINSLLTPDAWRYQSTSTLKGIPAAGDLALYGGGGYVAELSINKRVSEDVITELKNNRWIDRNTRAVFLEFTVFNSNVNMFAFATLLMEFPATGGALPFANVYTFRLYMHVGSVGAFVMFCEVVFLILLIYYTVCEILDFKKKRLEYFRNFTHVLQMIIIILSVCTIAMYVYRLNMTSTVIAELKANAERFANFPRLAFLDRCYIYSLAFVVFLTTIKLILLLQFNMKVAIFTATVSRAAKPIFLFLINFVIIFFAYAQFAYLVFGSFTYDYRDMLSTIEALFGLMLGEMNLEDLFRSNSLIFRVYFVSFVLLNYFALMNMFISVIVEAYEVARFNLMSKKNRYQVLRYMMSKFTGVIQLFKKNNKDEKR